MTTQQAEATPATATDTFAGLPEIFRDCVARSDGSRHDFRLPMLQGGHVYATDGHICVRVAVADLPPEVAACAVVTAKPDFAKVFAQAQMGVEQAVTALDSIDDGPAWIPCPECKGKGWANCNMGHDHDCEVCVNGQVQDLCHVTLTTPTGHVHRLCHAWAAVLKKYAVELHMPQVAGGAAKFVGMSGGVKFDGVVMMIDPKTPKE